MNRFLRVKSDVFIRQRQKRTKRTIKANHRRSTVSIKRSSEHQEFKTDDELAFTFLLSKKSQEKLIPILRRHSIVSRIAISQNTDKKLRIKFTTLVSLTQAVKTECKEERRGTIRIPSCSKSRCYPSISSHFCSS